jgi:hypothetical protein
LTPASFINAALKSADATPESSHGGWKFANKHDTDNHEKREFYQNEA